LGRGSGIRSSHPGSIGGWLRCERGNESSSWRVLVVRCKVTDRMHWSLAGPLPASRQSI